MRRLDRLIEGHVYCDPATASYVLAAVAAVGTAVTVEEQRAAAADSRKAARAQKRTQDIKAARERRRQIRDAQVAQAEIEAAAVVTGGAGSSSVSQAAGSVQGQLASNLSFLDNIQQLSDRQSLFLEKASKHRGTAATSSAVTGLASQGASIFSSVPPKGVND